MRLKLLFLVGILASGCQGPVPAYCQLASPFSNSVYPAQIFTASSQTGTPIQLNGLVTSSTVGSSFASATITVTGSSLTTVTFGVQGSSDNGVTYYLLPIVTVANPTGSPTTTVTATSNGLYQVNLAGLTHVRFVTSGTFTATNVTLTLTASPNAMLSRGAGGGGGGGVTGFNGRTGSVTLQAGDVNALSGITVNTSGNAGSASALAVTPSLCPTGQAPTGVLPNGNATGCAPISGGGAVSSFNSRTGAVTLNATDVNAVGAVTNNTSGNAGTATALATTPSQCGSGQFAQGIAANGNAQGCGAGGSGVTWPTTGDAVISNGTNSPAGLAPVNGDCIVGSAASWAAGSCTSGVSAQIKYLSVAGCPQDSDGTAGGGTSGTACVNGLYAAATANNPIVAWQDKGVTLLDTNGIQCPVSGGCFLAGNGWGLSTVSITNCVVTSHTATFTIAPATLAVGQKVQLLGLSNCAALNQDVVSVLSTGLGSTQFEATVSPATISSGAEPGCVAGSPNGACGVTVLGTGFYLAANSGDAISNGVVPSSGSCDIAPGTIQSRIGAGFGISNVFFNGNGANQSNSCFGADFNNANNVFIENVLFYNMAKYAVKMANVTQVDIDHLHVYAANVGPSAPINTDGVHIEGPASDITIANSYFRTGDDAIALNAVEGYCGPIQRVAVTNSLFDDARSAFRAYNNGAVCPNGTTPTVAGVTLDGYSGSVYNSMANLGFTTTGTLNPALNDIKWSNSVIDTQGVPAIGIENNVGRLDLDNVTIKGAGGCILCSDTTAGQTIATLKLHNLSLVGTSATANAPVLFGNYSCACNLTISDFIIDGLGLYNDPGGSWAASDPFDGSGNSGTITNMYADNVSLNLLNPSTYGNVTNLNGTIGPNSWAHNPSGGPQTFNAYGGGTGFDFAPHNTGGSSFNRFYDASGNVVACQDNNNDWWQFGGLNTSKGCDSNFTSQPIFFSPTCINWNRKPGVNGPAFGTVGNAPWCYSYSSTPASDCIHQQMQASGAGGPTDVLVQCSDGTVITPVQQLGPASAPSGSCSRNGAWVFSQDGHATYCNAGTWATKI